MRFSRRVLLTWAAVTVAAAGCKEKKPEKPPALQGSGVAAQRSREVPGFSRLDVDARVSVQVTIGPHGPAQIQGDDNLVERVKLRVEEDVLYIETEQPVSGKLPLEVRVTTPSLAGVVGKGASKIAIHGLDAESFDARGIWATHITAEGKAGDITLTGRDAAQLDFTKVPARSAKVRLVKGATARVGPLDDLDIQISGASRVFYEGEPRIKKDVTRPAFLVKTK